MIARVCGSMSCAVLLLFVLLLSARPVLGAAPIHGEVEGGGPAFYIVHLVDDPVASYRGDIAGFPATTPALTGQRRLDARSPASLAYESYLADRQQLFLNELSTLLGRTPEVRFHYRHALNGVAVLLSPEDARRAAGIDGVLLIEREREEQLHTDAGPFWLRAHRIWGGNHHDFGYGASLSGTSEVPPNGSLATGAGTFSFDLTSRQLTYSISHSGLASVTSAHIHSGAVGVNGPIVHALDHTSNPIQGSWTIPPGDIGLLANGLLYVNIHTASFPGGEIRGQVLPTGNLGEGVIVGVLDTGINQGHPAFAAVAADGYVHQNPNGPGNFAGYCESTPAFCNAKLIGAWALHPSSTIPADSNGHGSHTASTAAGNILLDAEFIAPTQSHTFEFVSGVAPRANIIAYQVCVPSCPTTATTAAVNQAVIDGVDVINYSISGGTNPYVETTAVAFRNATAAGVLVATSAGNSGPGASTVGHQGPWLLTTGATTHDREVVNMVTGLTSSAGGLPDIFGESPTVSFGPAPLVYAGDAPYNNPLCNPFPAGTFSGQIVVCDRGAIGRVLKGQNVLNAGGGGMILANDLPNAASLNADAHVLPATHISYADGVTLKNWMAAGSGHTGSISGGTVSYGAPGDNMASFSSRGPAGSSVAGLANLVKPDITAPGLNILAAYSAGFSVPPEFNIISGTSMSSPHAAGAAALLRQRHPGWTPAEIKSALMMSATSDINREDNQTPGVPFDFGAGRIDLELADRIGFVLHVSNAEYVAANPATGGDPRLLNLPSMGHVRCEAVCTWTRTVRSVLGSSQSYSASVSGAGDAGGSVSPSSFTLAAGGTQVISISFEPGSAPLGGWTFGQVVISPDSAPDPKQSGTDSAQAARGFLPAIATARMPIAVRSVPPGIFSDGFEVD